MSLTASASWPGGFSFWGRVGRSVHAWLAFGQFLLLILAVRIESRRVWGAALAGIALLALLAWVTALRRRRAIGGTPTSRIVSAAQGYVELRGRGRSFDVNPLHSPLTLRPCLWYRYEIQERDRDRDWKTVEELQSDASFVLDDGSANCLVDPEGAEIVTRHYRSWSEGDRRYKEWILDHGDALYVLGNFVTRHPAEGLDAGSEVRELLATWKQDRVALLKRFDLDRDGEINEREWELARRLGRGQIEKCHRELRLQPELHLIQGAASGPYLISNHEPERLARHYLWIGLGQLTLFFVALAGLAWWSRQPSVL